MSESEDECTTISLGSDISVSLDVGTNFANSILQRCT